MLEMDGTIEQCLCTSACLHHFSPVSLNAHTLYLCTLSRNSCNVVDHGPLVSVFVKLSSERCHDNAIVYLSSDIPS